MEPLQHGIVRAASLLVGLELVSQVTGLLRLVLIAAEFGTSDLMDAFLVATAVAGLIRVWVSLPIKQTVIPMFRYDLTQQGERAAWANVSLVFNNLVLVLAVIVVVVGLLAPYLVAAIAPGADKTTNSLAATLVRISVLGVLFTGLQGVLSQILFSYGRFARPGMATCVDNLVVIAFLVVPGTIYGIHGLALAAVLGAVAQFGLQLGIVWEKRRLYSTKVDIRHPRMLELGKLSFPLLMSAGGNEFARITDRIFASLLPAGQLSALAFAYKLAGSANDLFLDPAQQATFPHFTKLSAEANFGQLSRELFRYLRVTLFLAVPMAVGMMLVADLIVRVVYQRGAFGETSVGLTAQALALYAIGAPAVAASRMLTRTFFGLKDTKTPSKIALFRVALKIGLCWLFVGRLAHVGIALAESLSQVAKGVLLLRALPDSVKGQERRRTLLSFARSIAAAAVMGAVVHFSRLALDGLWPAPVELAVLVALGVGIYGVIALLSGAEEGLLLMRALASLRDGLASPRAARRQPSTGGL